MKIVHIESGLGNQMLSFCEYLVLTQYCGYKDVYIETIIYDIPECNDIICQWNGFELDRIFGINAPNIRETFSKDEWEEIIQEIRETRFWEKNWNYPVYFVEVFNRHGLNLINYRGDFEATDAKMMVGESTSWKTRLRKSKYGYYLKAVLDIWKQKLLLKQFDKKRKVFLKTNENIFTGQRLSFKYMNNGIELLDSVIRSTFIFKEPLDSTNENSLKQIENTNSIAIHARRGDMLGQNGVMYEFGYFRRSVKLIKKKVDSPSFFFFCDPGSVKWCKENANIFGLDFINDDVHFVDWNYGEQSYRDMQLMAACKHHIITNSSFGWWGAYLSMNSNKVTISPGVVINTSYHLF